MRVEQATQGNSTVTPTHKRGHVCGDFRKGSLRVPYLHWHPGRKRAEVLSAAEHVALLRAEREAVPLVCHPKLSILRGNRLPFDGLRARLARDRGVVRTWPRGSI